MSIAKTATVTAFLSLSGILFLNAILNLSKEPSHQRAANEPPNQNASESEPDEIASPQTAQPKRGIAQPEKLAQPPLTSGAGPQRQPAALPQINPLLIAPNSQASNPASGDRMDPAISNQRNNLTPLKPGIVPPQFLSNQPETRAGGERSRADLLAPLTNSLKDIEGHWAQYYIEFLLSRNAIQGFPDGKFRPDRTITAAEFSLISEKAFRGTTPVPVSYRELQGLTPARPATRAEAAALIYRTLMRTEVVPVVTSVQIKGAVARPGGYSLAAVSDARIGKGKNLPTVSRAIQQAGGLLATGNLRQVEIHRTTEMGNKKVIKVDVQRVLQREGLAQDVVLQQDDKLVIPAMTPSAQFMPSPQVSPQASPQAGSQASPKGQAMIPISQEPLPSKDPLSSKGLELSEPERPNE